MEHEINRKEKVCQEEECREAWDALPAEILDQCDTFVYCPFCANEMVTRCSGCGEAINDMEYQYCPWCGCEFGAEPGEQKLD